MGRVEMGWVGMKKHQTLETKCFTIISKHFEVVLWTLCIVASNFLLVFEIILSVVNHNHNLLSLRCSKLTSFSDVNLLQCTFFERHSISVIPTSLLNSFRCIIVWSPWNWKNIDGQSLCCTDKGNRSSWCCQY